MDTRKTSFARRLWTALALAALLAPQGLAQNAPPVNPRSGPAVPPPQVSANAPGTIRASVELVEVDVAVTDRDGKPVKGLRQDQFTVSEDGHDQKASAFTTITTSKKSRPPNPPTLRR